MMKSQGPVLGIFLFLHVARGMGWMGCRNTYVDLRIAEVSGQREAAIGDPSVTLRMEALGFSRLGSTKTCNVASFSPAVR